MKILDPREGYDKYAAEYRKDHGHLDGFDWDESRILLAGQIEYSILSRHPDPESPLRILDFGCGDGRVLKRLVKLLATRSWTDVTILHGMDISQQMLLRARKFAGPSVTLFRADILDGSPAALAPFDLVYAFFVLVHVAMPGRFFASARTFLSPGARLILNSFPQRDAPVLESGGEKFKIEYYHHRPEEILKAAAENSFSLVESRKTAFSTLYVFEYEGPAPSGAGT